MKGDITIKIQNNRNIYDFTLHRNITILRGDSGSGKSTLYHMVQNYSREGRQSGVRASVTDDRNLYVLEGPFWEDELEKIHDSVVLVDEDSHFIRSRDFARAIEGSSNYYLLITRNYLADLPYSVTEIYAIRGRKRKHFERIYHDTELMYEKAELSPLPYRPDIIITEDSGSGFQFLKSACEDNDIQCISASGKSQVIQCVSDHLDQKVLVVADGAAFGPEIEDLVGLEQAHYGSLALYLPESFEWLILRSGVVSDPDSDEIIHAGKYIESSRFFSWERYFTSLLIQYSKDSVYASYHKGSLDPYYMNPASQRQIKSVMTPIDF